jgi:hypothetical protein
MKLAFLLAGCLAAGAAAAEPEIGGSYRREGEADVRMTIRRDGPDLDITILGGAAAQTVAADCTLRALGTLTGSVVTARFGPIETDTMSYAAAEAEQEGRMLIVSFQNRGARVTRADTLGYCGLGIDFTGPYSRAD